jgi:hypothetical protein
LLASGHAGSVTAIDLEDMRDAPDERVKLITADLRTLDPRSLPVADAALMLNVAHHLLDAGPSVLRRLIGGLLERAPVVLVDMGSLTEPDRWLWRHLMGRWWASDEAMWADLFAPARWRTPLCSYDYQGGRRTLWKLEGDHAGKQRYEVLGLFRRTVAANADLKRLIEVVNEKDEPIPFGAAPGDLCPEVLFRLLSRDGTEELFWAKQYTGGMRSGAGLQALEQSVHTFLRNVPFRCCLPRERHPSYGHVYGFQQELFDGRAVHHGARRTGLSPHAATLAEEFGELLLDEGLAANLPLRFVTDFQCVEHDSCVTFLDFEANHRFLAPLQWLLASPNPSVLVQRRNRLLDALDNAGTRSSHDAFAVAPRPAGPAQR